MRVSKEFAFLFTSARAIFVVPRRTFSEADEQAFLALVASRSTRSDLRAWGTGKIEGKNERG
ncbi:YcxB family protein [Dyella lipolytica]|uniref:YcxB family protein n=1 Tax=Dyella lipolytica TaxID=1867835 RepID=A0ABW8IXD1_9GAMM